MRVVGVPSIPGPNVEAFRQGLKDLGYLEGKNIVIEFRYAQGKPEHIPGLVAELVKLKVDVLISPGRNCDPNRQGGYQDDSHRHGDKPGSRCDGLVDSLARPGGNITGISRLTRELSGKRLELLTEVVPGCRAWASFGIRARGAKNKFQGIPGCGWSVKVTIAIPRGTRPRTGSGRCISFSGQRARSALITIGNTLLNRHRKQIADYAIKHRLPSMYESSQWVEPAA